MPADLECPATPPELPREPTPERLKLSPAGSPSGRASPDSACPICLGRRDNPAFTDGCTHKFCFTCIVEWSKVRAVCPLCKQGFTSIVHNVRSDMDYDRYRLPAPPSAVDQHPYIYRPGDGDESRSRWLQMRRQQHRFRSLVLPMLWRPADSADYRLPSAPPGRSRPAARSRVTSQSRRTLYETDVWARPTADSLTGLYRETGPEFYRMNPACTHRLVPWLNRELNAVLDSGSHLAHVLEQIMELITRMHILSPQFRAHLQPYVGGWTEHFVHELYSYARSPYDMIGYDLHVSYDQGRPAVPSSERVDSTSSSSSDSSDSDVQMLPRPPTPILVEPVSPTPGPSGVRVPPAGSGSDSDSDSAVQVVTVLPPRHQRQPEVVTLSSGSESRQPPLPSPPPPPPPPMAVRSTSRRHRSSKRSREPAVAGARKRRRSTERVAKASNSHRKECSNRGKRFKPSEPRRPEGDSHRRTASARTDRRTERKRHKHGEKRSRTRRSTRFDSDSDSANEAAPAQPSRPSPESLAVASTSAAHPSHFQRIRSPVGSSSERPSSSSSVAARSTPARCRRLSDSSGSSDTEQSRPAVRSAVVVRQHVKLHATSDSDSDSGSESAP